MGEAAKRLRSEYSRVSRSTSPCRRRDGESEEGNDGEDGEDGGILGEWPGCTEAKRGKES